MTNVHIFSYVRVIIHNPTFDITFSNLTKVILINLLVILIILEVLQIK